MRSSLGIATLVAVLLVLSAQAGATKPQLKVVKYTQGPVLTLALDGPRVAYFSRGRVYVWNVATGAASAIKGTYPSDGKGRWTNATDHEVAIAGTRVAFVTRFSVGWYDETSARLYLAPVGGWAHRLGPVLNSGRTGGGGWSFGSFIGGPVGAGDLLAVSTWHADNSFTYDRQLRLVTPTGLHTIATLEQGPIVAESVAGGRIAVVGSSSFDTVPSDTVRIYSRTGALLRELAPSSIREIALSGKQLSVLTETNTIEVYDWTTGGLLHTWPIAAVPPDARPAHLAVYGHRAVYAIDRGYEGPRTLRVLNLETGKDMAVAWARGGGHAGDTGGYTSHDAALGQRGLAYVVTYTAHDHPRELRGKVVFVPTARLLSLVG